MLTFLLFPQTLYKNCSVAFSTNTSPNSKIMLNANQAEEAEMDLTSEIAKL